MVMRLRRQGTSFSAMGHLASVNQRVHINSAALTHVQRFCQTSARATEAGGQLFGTITPELVHVTAATGPYPQDERSRHRYRSDPVAAQRMIHRQSQAGLLYLGEWHTHAEDCPNASNLDDDAMRQILKRSRLNSNALLLLIVGRLMSIDGIALWCVTSRHTQQWKLQTI